MRLRRFAKHRQFEGIVPVGWPPVNQERTIRSDSGFNLVMLFWTWIPSARQRSISCREVIASSWASSFTLMPFLATDGF